MVQEAPVRLLEYGRTGKVWDADPLLRRIVVNLSINHYHSAPWNRFEFESLDKADRRGPAGRSRGGSGVGARRRARTR